MKPYQGISAYLSFVVLPFIVSGLIESPAVCVRHRRAFVVSGILRGRINHEAQAPKSSTPDGPLSCLLCDTGSSCARRHF